MEAKHTPGPWAVETESTKRPKDCTRYFITADNGKLTIAEFLRTDRLKDEAQANAKLIAAAPELLADHISDVTLIEDFVKRHGDSLSSTTAYFLNNLLVSKREIIKNATK